MTALAPLKPLRPCEVTLRVTIPGPPVPKERARAGQGGHHYTPEATRAYEAHSRLYAQVAVQRCKWGQPTPRELYSVRMDVYFPDARRRDLTNVCKAIEDACNGVLWHDDSQIKCLYLFAEVDRVRPRVELEVMRMAGGGKA